MQIPKIKLDEFKTFVTSPEIIAVGSAILITPFLQTAIDGLVAKIPLLQNHLTLGLVIVAFLIFIFAMHIHGIFGAVLIGIAGGILITGLTPAIEQMFPSLAGKLPSGGQ